jgi:hypothetical protein
LLVEAYYLTSKPIVQAICDAKDRRVVVSVVLDRSNEQDRYQETTKMLDRCADVLVDDKVRIHHNKVLVIDRAGRASWYGQDADRPYRRDLQR